MKCSNYLLPIGLSLLLVSACGTAPADSANENGEPLGTLTNALCAPPVYSGFLDSGHTMSSFQSPVGYQSSCDAIFWTQSTILANTGRYVTFFASVDLRVPTTQADCALVRFIYQLHGQSGGTWVPVKLYDVLGGTWDMASGSCRINNTYSMSISAAKAYSSFMLGGYASINGVNQPIINTMALTY